MAVTNSKGLEMEEKIKELEKRVDVLYAVLYWDHFRSVDNIITKRKKNRQLLTDELTSLSQKGQKKEKENCMLRLRGVISLHRRRTKILRRT